MQQSAAQPIDGDALPPGIRAEPIDVAVGASDRRVVTVALPDAGVLLRGVCGATASSAQGAHLRGVVVDSGGLPVADASVTVSCPPLLLRAASR